MRAARFILPLLLVAGAAHLLHLQAGARMPMERSTDEVPRVYTPDGTMLRKFAMGHATTLSDLYWLKLIQYVGTGAAQDAGWPQLLPLAHLVTDIDPLHGYAYEIGGLVLVAAKRPKESVEILEKGVAAVPNRWQLPFFAAYNHFYELNDFRRGAELLERASKLEGAPEWLPLLATRLYSRAGDIDAGIAMVETMLRGQAIEAERRQELEARRDALIVERNLRTIEGAIDEFQRRRGRKPATLQELVGTVLSELPPSPQPSLYDYDYDPTTGKVTSPLLPSRLTYRKPEERAQELPE